MTKRPKCKTRGCSSNDAANDAATLWRERCNAAEQKADVLTTELRRLYAAVCHGQTRSDDARAIAQAVIDEYIQTAEQCDRNDTLRADRDAARFLAAGWRRLAETVAAHRWVAQHSLTLSDSLRSQLDDSEARVADLRAKLARAEGVVGVVRAPPAADKHALYAAASRIEEPGPGESVAAGRPRVADTTISSTSTTGAEATTHTCAAPPERP